MHMNPQLKVVTFCFCYLRNGSLICFKKWLTFFIFLLLCLNTLTSSVFFSCFNLNPTLFISEHSSVFLLLSVRGYAHTPLSNSPPALLALIKKTLNLPFPLSALSLSLLSWVSVRWYIVILLLSNWVVSGIKCVCFIDSSCICTQAYAELFKLHVLTHHFSKRCNHTKTGNGTRRQPGAC